jgi:hypothetical protein
MLQGFDEPIALFFVMLGCPVIIKIVEDLDTSIKLVQEST